MSYVRINSINDLDPRRIPITDLKKKYIDREGNRYAARFNPLTRSVEIVYLVSSREEALRLRNEIKRKKRLQSDPDDYSYSIQQESPPSEPAYSSDAADSTEEDFKIVIDEDTADRFNETNETHQNTAAAKHIKNLDEGHFDPYHEDEYFAGEEQQEVPLFGKEADLLHRPFYEGRFTEETFKLLEKTNDRLFAVVNSTKKARLFETYLQDEFFEITRQIDGEARKSIEHAMNYYKEITLYPRALSYYMTRISDEQKAILDEINEEDVRFEKVKRWELQRVFRETFSTVRIYTDAFHNLLSHIPEEQKTSVPHDQRTLIDNALTSTELVIQDCANSLNQIEYWEKTHP